MRSLFLSAAIAAAAAFVATTGDADAAARCAYAAGPKGGAAYERTLEIVKHGGVGSSCIGADVQRACYAAFQGCARKAAGIDDPTSLGCEKVFHEVRAVILAPWETCPNGPVVFDHIAKTPVR